MGYVSVHTLQEWIHLTIGHMGYSDESSKSEYPLSDNPT